MIDNKLLYDKQSEVIEFIRFPLIVLVVYVHMLPFQQQPISSDLTIQNAYVLLSEVISHHVGRLAVPCFFLFSGYFFFNRIANWNNTQYLDNLKKRYRTLLLPYIAWNLIAILAIIIKNKLFIVLGYSPDESYLELAHVNIYDLFWGMPINYPFWYLRDLIAMTLLAPLFFYFLKYLKAYGLLIIAAFYLSLIESNIPGLSSTAIFFFGSGAFFGLFKYNMLQLSLQYGKVTVWLSLIFLTIATYYTSKPQNEFWIRLYAVFSPASILYIGYYLSSFNKLKKRIFIVAQAAFFVYALHLIYILGWLKGAWLKASLLLPKIFLIIGYFMTPLICVSFILFLYFTMKRFLPQTLGFLTGNRAN